jgi:hypothetical protein
MKIFIRTFVIIGLISFSFQTKAQVKFGVLAGLNLTNVKVATIPGVTDRKMHLSYHFGGVADYKITKSFALEAGLLLSGKGTEYKYTNKYTNESSLVYVEGKVIDAPLYLEIPLNAMYIVDLGNARLLLFTGPYIGIGVAGKEKPKLTGTGFGVTVYNDKSRDIKYGTDDDCDFKRSDFGLNIGTGFEIKKIQIRVQYSFGLANINPTSSSDNKVKNRVICMSIGYMFGK